MDARLRRHLDALFVRLAADVGVTLATGTDAFASGLVVAALFALGVYTVLDDPMLVTGFAPGE